MVGQWKEKRVEYGTRYIAAVKGDLMNMRDEWFEASFQSESQKSRRHVKELSANRLPEPRIIEDVTGKGAAKLLSTPLWRPGIGGSPRAPRADLPTSKGEATGKTRVWDFWLTDYPPGFGQHSFGDCPCTVQGEGLMT